MTTFVWDWANPTMSGGIPEMLSAGGQAMDEPIALYLVSYDTLGYWDSASPGEAGGAGQGH